MREKVGTWVLLILLHGSVTSLCTFLCGAWHLLSAYNSELAEAATSNQLQYAAAVAPAGPLPCVKQLKLLQLAAPD